MSRRTVVTVVIAGLVLAVGLIVGLAVAGSSGSGQPDVAITTSTGLPPGAQTETQPTVTSPPSIVTTPAADLPGHGKPRVWVGDMNTDQQFVIGALYKSALQNAGYVVLPDRNIGRTAVSLAALKEGTLDIFPEYLNQWNRGVAGLTRHFQSLRAAFAAATAYANKHGFKLLKPAPGGRTDGFAVTSQFARENHLYSFTQLHRLPELTFGIPLGFGALWKAERAYSFRVGTRQVILTGNQYSQLTGGVLQAAWVYSTDPQLALPTYTLLKDPKHVFGYANIVPVTTPAVIRAEGPAFVRIINQVDSLLTTRALRGLTEEVEVGGHDPTTVANDFLIGNGLLPPARYVVVGR